MNYIKSLHIEGLKKFRYFNMNFNKHMNILVGENEAGKTTILDAIKTVLNQQYLWYNYAIQSNKGNL